jgi:hypothetical protein
MLVVAKKQWGKRKSNAEGGKKVIGSNPAKKWSSILTEWTAIRYH